MLHKVSKPNHIQAEGFRGTDTSGEAGEAGPGAEAGAQGTAIGRLAATGAPPLGKAKARGITLCT